MKIILSTSWLLSISIFLKYLFPTKITDCKQSSQPPPPYRVPPWDYCTIYGENQVWWCSENSCCPWKDGWVVGCQYAMCNSLCSSFLIIKGIYYLVFLQCWLPTAGLTTQFWKRSGQKEFRAKIGPFRGSGGMSLKIKKWKVETFSFI